MGINFVKQKTIDLASIRSSSQIKKSKSKFFTKDTLVTTNIFLFMLSTLIAIGFILFYWRILNESQKAKEEANYFKNELITLTIEQEGYVELAGKTNLLKSSILSDNLHSDIYYKIKNLFDQTDAKYSFQSIFYDGNYFTYSFVNEDYKSAALFINILKESEQLQKLFSTFQFQRSKYNIDTSKVITSIRFSVEP